MPNLQQVYRDQCAAHNVKVNSIEKDLPTDGVLRTLDLSSTMVGPNGMKPFLEVIALCPDMESVVLKGQKLTSECVQEVVTALKGHPGVTSLNLSDNHCPLAGPAILDLVKNSTQILELDMTDCSIRPMFQKLVDLQLNKNKELAGIKVDSDLTKTTATKGGFCTFEEPFAKDDGGSDDDIFNVKATMVEPDGRPPSGGSGVASFGSFKDAPKQNMLRPGSSTRRDKRRPTVSAEVWRDEELDTYEAPKHDKPAEATKWLCEKLEHVHLFSHLDDRELMMAVDAMQKESHNMNAVVRRQGDDGSDSYSIIYAGECDSVAEETSRALKAGDSFGEVQLMYHQDETETVTVTSSELVCYSIERDHYRRILAKSSKAKRALYEGFLQNVNFLKGLTKSEHLHIADALKTTKLQATEHLIRYGEEGLWFYLIVEGTVEVIGRDAATKEPVKVCEFTVGDCVGELEFINNHVCVADVVAVGDVRAAKMNRKHFEMFMGPVVDLLKRTAASSDVYEYYRQTQGQDKQEGEQEAAFAADTQQDAGGDAGGFCAFGGDAANEDSGFGGFGVFQGADEPAPPPMPAARRRQTVSAEVITEDDINTFQPQVVPKDEKARDFLAAALERLGLFCHLEDFEIKQLTDAMEEMNYGKDETIIEEGNEGDVFHLVYNGEVVGVESATPDAVKEYKPGQHFGEVALMYAQPHGMTYKGGSHDVRTYTLDRNTYKHIMQKASMKKRAMYGEFLKNVGFLKSLSEHEVLHLADALKPASYRPGEHLINFGDDGLWFYIVVEGDVEVYGRDAEKQVKKVCEFTVGDCVGELEFINNHKCVADVVAKGPVRTAKMHRHHFEQCMGPIVDILKRAADALEKYEYYRETLQGKNAPVEST
eukprot:TRINITY_DN319_c0_g2_i2.p2 TRINITY_DN319_c0_g2~~TRINITY_DN319_c0_g2_i2.p2  ORF type:complete len:879 (+),score=441.58 TRINITY_DN319_c0_g2_i2:215-2851(+)